MQKVITDFHCNLCKKYYSSYQSLWIHNKKFHTNNVVSNVVPVVSNVVSNVVPVVPNVVHNVVHNVVPISLETKKYNCKLCNKEFNNRCNKWRHEQLCKKKNNTIDNINNNELIELKNKNTELENSLKEIKELLINSKIHHKTLQKINNQLNNTTNNNNITINNTINLVSLGSENLSEVLNKKEKLNILKDMYGSLCKIVQYIHFNDKFPQFKTMLITNMQNNIAYKYDEDENRFITISKDELLNDLISIRLDDIIAFNEEVGEKLDINSKKKIETFLDTIDNNEKLRENKKSELKIILYNNRNFVEMIK
jgi:hypothetical protein